MSLNDFLVLELIILISIILLQRTTNPITFTYLAGFFLFLIGFLMLDFLSTVFVGFLWLIDFGLGVIVILSILLLTKFFNFKTIKNIFKKSIYLFLLYLIWSLLNTSVSFRYLTTYYSFYTLIFFLDYYHYFYIIDYAELHLLRYIYFLNNIAEFSLINSFLFFAIFFVLSFFYNLFWIILVKKNTPLFNLKKKWLQFSETTNFTRTQNFSKQLNTSSSVFTWKKK